MIAEALQVKRYLGARFGYGEPIPNGIYAVPTSTSKGKAYMRIEIKDGKNYGDNNFSLYWDEQLTLSWHKDKKPLYPKKESAFAAQFRKLEAAPFI